MKIINPKAKKIGIICCQHGNEIFGLQVFKYFQKNSSKYPEVKVILANEKAIELGKRYFEEDLNRSFGSNKSNSYEAKLAKKILKEIKSMEYVIDIHTTTSDIKFIPIVISLHPGIRKILRLCPSRHIAYMKSPLGDHSLIKHVKSAVSLEFNEKYARTSQALHTVLEIVNELVNSKHGKLKREKREVYMINQTIPLDRKLPSSAKNLKYLKQHKIYPFLLGEKHYTSIQGFAASSFKEIKL